MKSRAVIIFGAAMMCIWAGILPAQDNVPLPPGYGGQMGDNVPLPPGYGARESGFVPLPPGYGDGMPGMGMPGSAGRAGIEDQEFPEDIVARCLLKISCDPSVLHLDYRIMKHLWFSTGVLDKAYRTVLNDSNSVSGQGNIILINAAGAPANMVYAVGMPFLDNRKEKEILAAAVENLKTALTKMADQERERLMDQLRQTARRSEEMEKQVAEMQVEIRNITQEGITNRQEVQEKISGLKNSMADIQMRLQYSDVRIKELRIQKEELQITIEKSLAADAVTEELKNIVKGTEESLAMIEKMFNTGQTPTDKVQEAKEKLARAKIELAKRMEEVRKNAGQDQFADIDGKIAETTSQISELKLGYNFKEQEYARIKDLLAKSDALELREMKLNAVKGSFYQTLNACEILKNQLQMQQSLSVSVMGLD